MGSIHYLLTYLNIMRPNLPRNFTLARPTLRRVVIHVTCERTVSARRSWEQVGNFATASIVSLQNDGTQTSVLLCPGRCTRRCLKQKRWKAAAPQGDWQTMTDDCIFPLGSLEENLFQTHSVWMEPKLSGILSPVAGPCWM